MNEVRGISEENRRRLEELHRRFAGPFATEDAARVWRVERARAKRLLAHMAGQGWLVRLRRDLYITVPLGATAPHEWRADPWVVAATTFAPCYLGGWTACEHWGLTEQLFRDVVVITSRETTPRNQVIQETVFRIKVTSPERFFGLADVWRGEMRIPMSNPSRTIVDLLDDPRLGGGMRHIADVVQEYFEGELRADDELLEFAERLGNRTVFKRLGYLVEALGLDASNILATCREKMSSGISLLDPSAPASGKILRRWRLRLNVRIGETNR
ncbi:MAG: hypothetical protein GXP47_00810 [Acidobacteria bacterium]|nr:hypothetical protein [Acidobacteriota bacterium]